MVYVIVSEASLSVHVTVVTAVVCEFSATVAVYSDVGHTGGVSLTSDTDTVRVPELERAGDP